MASPATIPSPARSLVRTLRAGFIGALIAAVANLALFVIAGALRVPLNVTLGPPGPDTPATALSPVQVVVASVLPAFVGSLIYWGLSRAGTGARAIFLALAIGVALLSFVPILAQPLSPVGMFILGLMHVVAAVAITWALLTQSPV